MQQFEDVARHTKEGEAEDSPWLALTAHLRTFTAQLEFHEPPEHASLRQRAEAAVARALAEGNADDRRALAERLCVAADAHVAGQRPGSSALALAARLHTLAERLEAGDV